MTEARDVIAKYAAQEIFDEGHDCPRGDCDGVCKGDCSVWKIDCLGHADATINTLRAAGFAVVPVEPTEDMLIDGNFEFVRMPMASAVWKAMLKVAQGGTE